MSFGDDEEKQKTADAILEMLRDAGVSTKNLEEKKHAFWDTQVGETSLKLKQKNEKSAKPKQPYV